jgi:integrase
LSVFKPKGREHYVYDFVFKGRRHHGTTGATTERKAQAVEAAKREALALAFARQQAGEPAPLDPADIPTLDKAAKDWWDFHGRRLGREHDEDFRLTRLTNAVALVGRDKLVTELRTKDIRDAMLKRQAKPVRRPGSKGLGKLPEPATVNRDVIETIRPVINNACAALDVAPPPIAWGKVRLKTPKAKPRSFAPDAIEAFYAALPEHWQEFARFEARYGCRVAEMFFDPADVHPDGPEPYVMLADRKAGDELALPLLPEDAAMLAARKSQAEAAGLSTVWFRQLKGWSYNRGQNTPRIKALTRNGAVWAIRKAMRASGLRGAKGSHDLRHHAAMTALRVSGNLRAVQKLLGHADIKSTLVYAHALSDDVRSVLGDVAAKSQQSQQSPSTVLREVENGRENSALAG